MIEVVMGIFTGFKTKARAHAAAVSHRWPAKRMQVILIVGADGGDLTIATLASILRTQGAKVGVITAHSVEIAGERVEGSDQANVLGDPFRMQALMAQMRRAGCGYVLIEVPTQLPAHNFAGLQPTMAIMRRCGDSHVNEAHNAARKAMWRKIMSLHPEFVVLNRDDPCYAPITGLREAALMTYGAHEKAECQITEVRIHPKGSAAKLLVDHQTELNVTTVLTGKTAMYSVVAAASAAYLLHVPIGVIEDGVAAQQLAPGGLRYVNADRPYQIALDSCVTPDGVAESLETLKHFAKNRLVVVIGATLTMQPEWRVIIGELVAKSADRIVITDGEFTAEESAQTVRAQLLQGVMAAGADARAEEVAEREAAFEKALSIARRGDTIAVLGSGQRQYRLVGGERVVWSDEAKIEELLG